MDQHLVRRLAPFVFVVAVLLAVFIGDGGTVGAVAAIGGVCLGAVYALTRPAGGRVRDRRRDQARNRTPEHGQPQD